MLFKSEVITQGSGSIGGVTYSHNRGGLYRRARAIPVNPNTGFQVVVRAALTQAVTRWTSTLTETERAGWNLYAANTPVLGVLGDMIQLSGQNMYIRSHSVLAQLLARSLTGAGIAEVDNPPTVFNLGDFTTPSFVADVSSGLLITFDNSDDWANEGGSTLNISMGRPQNPSVNFYNGPWRLVSTAQGDDVTPPTSPLTIAPGVINTDGYPFVVGQKVWTRYRVLRQDGRLSSDRIVGPQLAIA